MFVVKRTVTNLKRNKDVDVQRFEHDNLCDALEHMERLNKEDSARYTILLEKESKSFFCDYKSTETGYHYTIGDYKITCEIPSLREDAKKAFYMDRPKI